jgi:hypothetical protein
MASADETREQIAAGAQAFREAIESFSGDWEANAGDDGGEETWSARKVAEHTVGAVGFFAGVVATAMDARPAEKTGGEFAAASDVLPALDASLEILNRVFRYVEDHDMVKPVERPESMDWDATIGAAMVRSSTHFTEHAATITERSS